MIPFTTIATGTIITRVSSDEISEYFKVISTEAEYHILVENIDNPSDKRIVPYQFVGSDITTNYNYCIFIKRPTLPHSTIQELQQNYPELFV